MGVLTMVTIDSWSIAKK